MKGSRIASVDRRLLQSHFPLEVVLWLLGLGVLAISDPYKEHLFSFCPFSWVLEKGCLGCGLGHGIGFLARGEWQASWQAHPLAGPAVLLLLWRCAKLLLFYRNHYHTSTIPHVYGKHTTPVAGSGAGRNDLRTIAGAEHDRK